MGLDIYHCKATLERPKTTDPGVLLFDSIFREEFKGFNVQYEHFYRYIQEIDYPNVLETLIIVKQRDKLNEIKDWFKKSDYGFIVEESKEQLDHQLARYEKENGLESLYKHAGKEVIGGWVVLKYYEILKKEGFYFKEVGYQRKGMNVHFSERFFSDNVYNYALKEDFDFAYACVDYEWSDDTAEEVEARKKYFKEHFIDNFELGASFLWTSF